MHLLLMLGILIRDIRKDDVYLCASGFRMIRKMDAAVTAAVCEKDSFLDMIQSDSGTVGDFFQRWIGTVQIFQYLFRETVSAVLMAKMDKSFSAFRFLFPDCDVKFQLFIRT